MRSTRRFKILGILLLIIGLLPIAVHITAQQAEPFAAGDRVIVLPQIVPVRTKPSLSAPVVTELWGGMVTRVIAVEEDEDGEIWLYLDQNAYSWVPLLQDDEPTLAHFSEAVLDQMLSEATTDIHTGPDPIEAYLRRGTVHLSRREFTAAISDYTQAIQLAPAEGRYYEYRGKAYLDRGAYPKAAKDLERAVNLRLMEPETLLPGLYNRLAIAYLEQNEFQFALLHSLTAIDLVTGWGLMYSNTGSVFRRWEQYPEALDYFEQAIATDPYYSNVYISRGLLYDDTNEKMAALDDFNRATEIDPFDAEPYIQRGIWYETVQGNYAAAFESYEQAIALEPNNPRAYSNQGVMYRTLGNFAAAEDNLQKALEIDPFDVHARFNLAGIYSHIGRYEEALNAYTATMTLGDDYDLSILLYRLQVYVALGKDGLALRDLDQYLTHDLRNDFRTTAHLVRGSIYLRQGRYADAPAEYSAAFSTWNDFALYYADYGEGYWVAPQRAGLVHDLIAQIGEDPNPAALYIELGNLYMEFGLWEYAIESYGYALDMSPNRDLEAFIEVLEGLIDTTAISSE